MSFTLGVNQKVLLTIDEKDQAGNPIENPDEISVASSDESVLTVETVSSTQYWLSGTGKAGTVQVTVTDANDNLTGAETLILVPGKPASLGLSFGEPVDRDPAPTA